MSIDEQPMNVYWSGKRTETINRSKINYKGSVATFSDLPDTNNQKGDMYSVTGLGDENYIWDGTAWDSLGTSDADVVHKSGNETISGEKTFTKTAIFGNGKIKINTNGNFLRDSNSSLTIVCGGSALDGGAHLALRGKDNETSGGSFLLRAKQGSSGKDLVGSPDGTILWNGNDIQVSSDEKVKTSLVSVPDEILSAWGDVAWGQFQFLDAIEAKGEAARLHLGLIAQQVKAVFEAHGLDACAYGILCYEPQLDLWMVRYAEAQAMEAVYQRRRADRAEARIKALENHLEALEAKLA